MSDFLLDIMSGRHHSECVATTNILDEIKRLAGLGRIFFSIHALEKMDERGANHQDVQNALATATAANYQSDRDNYKVTGGVDMDGDDLRVIVDVNTDIEVVIVTVF